MSFSVILPTLNESGHIIDLINKISHIFKQRKIDFEIIVVDDSSIDKTDQIVSKHMTENEYLKLISRKGKKKNLASSINDGVKLAKFQYIIWMDADFQHPPEYIEKFIKISDKYDAIIASRFLKDSDRYFKDERYKKKVNENQSYFFNKLCKFLFFNDLTDYTSGFICIKRNCFNNLDLNGFYGDYFLNLIIELKKRKTNIIEIPFKDAERASGKSKTVVKINFNYLYTCVRYMLTLIKSFFKFKFNFY